MPLRHASSLAGHIDFRAKRHRAVAFPFDDRRQLPGFPVPSATMFAGVRIEQEPSEASTRENYQDRGQTSALSFSCVRLSLLNSRGY